VAQAFLPVHSSHKQQLQISRHFPKLPILGPLLSCPDYFLLLFLSDRCRANPQEKISRLASQAHCLRRWLPPGDYRACSRRANSPGRCRPERTRWPRPRSSSRRSGFLRSACRLRQQKFFQPLGTTCRPRAWLRRLFKESKSPGPRLAPEGPGRSATSRIHFVLDRADRARDE